MEDSDDLSHLEPNVKLAIYHLNKLYEIREETGWTEGHFGSFVSESHAYIRELVSNGTVEFKSSDYYYLKDIHEHLLEAAFYKRFPESLDV
jgi:hypothetical protein